MVYILLIYWTFGLDSDLLGSYNVQACLTTKPNHKSFCRKDEMLINQRYKFIKYYSGILILRFDQLYIYIIYIYNWYKYI